MDKLVEDFYNEWLIKGGDPSDPDQFCKDILGILESVLKKSPAYNSDEFAPYLDQLRVAASRYKPVGKKILPVAIHFVKDEDREIVPGTTVVPGPQSGTTETVSVSACPANESAEGAVVASTSSDKSLKESANECAVESNEIRKYGRQSLSDLELDELTAGAASVLEPKELDYLKESLRTRPHVFAYDEAERGHLNEAKYPPVRLYTLDHEPWNCAMPKIPPFKAQAAIDYLRMAEKNGIIEPCSGSYAGNWMLLPKGDGRFRFVQDFQELNRVSVKNSAIPPNPLYLTEAAAGRKILSKIDLISGYFQIPLDKRDRDLTGINTPLGMKRMTALPQGYTNSPAIFQERMRSILSDLLPDPVDIFIDDIIVMGPRDDDGTRDADGRRSFIIQHINDVLKVLDKLMDAGLTVSARKCFFAIKEVEILGYRVSPQGRMIEEEFKNSILKWPDLKTAKEVRSFLGTARVYRIFYRDFARISEPLNRLTREGTLFVWGEEEKKAFEAIKKAITEAPILVPFSVDDPSSYDEIVLSTDASSVGYGAVLEKVNEGKRNPILFESKCFDPKEQKNWSICKKELYAVKKAIEKFGPYLHGCRFTVRVDSTTVASWLRGKSAPDEFFSRWLTPLLAMDFKVVVISSSENKVADSLSRQYTSAVAMFSDEQIPEEYMPVIDYLLYGVLPPGDPSAIIRKSHRLLFHDGKLFRFEKNSSGPRRMVFGESTKKELIALFHDGIYGGHRGVKATFAKLRSWFYWPKLFEDVEAYVKGCKSCQLYDPLKKIEPLVPSFPTAVWQKVHVDLVEMPKGRGGVQYIIDARDDLSGFVVAEAITNKSPATIAKFLRNLIGQFGVCEIMVGDRGELKTAQIQSRLKALGIDLRLSSSYHPQTNGVVERGHKELVKALKRWLGPDRQGLWPDYLALAVLADNSTVHRTTGMSPFEMMFGRIPCLPLDLVPEVFIAKEVRSREELIEGRLAELAKFEECVDQAAEDLALSRLRAQDTWNARSTVRRQALNVGDFVLVSTERPLVKLSKFAHRWEGPYIIERVIGNGAYHLTEVDGTPLRRPFHGARLKWIPTPPRDIAEDGNPGEAH